MKKYFFSAIILKLVMFLAACQGKNVNTKSNFSTQDDGNNTRTITAKSDSISLVIEYSGDIQLNESETAIRSISPSGYLKYQKNAQILTAESNSQGSIEYKLQDGHKELSFDDNGKRFIAASIKEMLAYGFELEKRLPVFYTSGGSRAGLSEIENMKTDEVRVTCFEYLLSNSVLQEQELAEVARKIGLDLDTDLGKRRLLSKYAAYFLGTPLAVQPYFEAINKIGNDYEKANVLRDVIKLPLSGQTFDLLLAITGALHSDDKKASILGDLIKTDIKTEKHWVSLLEIAAQISSTAEKTNVMLQIAAKMPRKGQVETAYLKAAKTIAARAEYDQVTKAIQ